MLPLCANLKCTKGENGGRKRFDPRHRPGKATTCSPECTKELDVEKRKGRWARVGPAWNALSRERHRPIITQMPLGTLVRTRWSRPPNIKPCEFRLESGELCGEEFDSKKGATHCPKHRGKVRKKAYLKQHNVDNYETISKNNKTRHAARKQNKPPVTCKNPVCPHGENGQPKQWVRRMGKNDYCCKQCRLAVWDPAAKAVAAYHKKHPNARHYKPKSGDAPNTSS